MKTKHLIGRKDKIDFPLLKLYNIPAKIDTGAYTSAIHCDEIIEKESQLLCRFENFEASEATSDYIVFDSFKRAEVKSSNGHKEIRFKVRSEVIFFGKTYKIDLTLSTRDDMRFPVLIGRQFLRRKFLVDVDLENLSFNNKLHEHSHTIT